MSDALFVYGTLHPKRAPTEIASAVRRLKEIGKGNVRGELVNLGEFPGVILRKSGKSTVRGTVFSLPDDPVLLAELDLYEEYKPESPNSSLFLRKRITVSLDNGTRRKCWIYAYNPESA